MHLHYRTITVPNPNKTPVKPFEPDVCKRCREDGRQPRHGDPMGNCDLYHGKASPCPRIAVDSK